MKIVIDISEGHYKTLQRMRDVGLGYYNKAILNGKVLPEGHERLADADKVIDKLKSIERLHIDDELRISVLDAINTSILSEADKENI